MEIELLTKINERLDKMGQAFLELRQHIHAPAPVQERRYFVRHHASDMTDQIDTAHALAIVTDLKNIDRDAAGGRGKYAKLEDLCQFLNPILGKYQLSVKQIPSYNEHGESILITRFSHKSGQWYESVVLLTPEKPGGNASINQAYGTGVTYMRRYTLIAILGIGQANDPTDTDR